MKKLVLSWVLMMTVVSTLFAQTRQVTGKVTSSEDGSTIPGVSVSIKGTTTGTTTSADVIRGKSLATSPVATVMFLNAAKFLRASSVATLLPSIRST